MTEARTDAIWGTLSGEVRQAIGRRVSNPATVDDLVQEVFLRVHARRDSLRDDERLAAWVGRITRNIVADHYRSARPAGPLPEELSATPPPDPDAPVEPLARWVA
ncbi:MAG: sigma factor, partial [Myxococcota bacterium]